VVNVSQVTLRYGEAQQDQVEKTGSPDLVMLHFSWSMKWFFDVTRRAPPPFCLLCVPGMRGLFLPLLLLYLSLSWASGASPRQKGCMHTHTHRKHTGAHRHTHTHPYEVINNFSKAVSSTPAVRKLSTGGRTAMQTVLPVPSSPQSVGLSQLPQGTGEVHLPHQQDSQFTQHHLP
jgi:hypothetical protein